jgi:hypothetical protein
MLAQKQSMADGNKYCAEQGKQFIVIGTYVDEAQSGYQVDFRCLDKGDPGLVRPTPIPAPNIVIQDQRPR